MGIQPETYFWACSIMQGGKQDDQDDTQDCCKTRCPCWQKTTSKKKGVAPARMEVGEESLGAEINISRGREEKIFPLFFIPYYISLHYVL